MKSTLAGIVASCLIISTATAEPLDPGKIIMFKMKWLMPYIAAYCGWPPIKYPTETLDSFLIFTFPEEHRLGKAQADLENPIFHDTLGPALYCETRRPLYKQYYGRDLQ